MGEAGKDRKELPIVFLFWRLKYQATFLGTTRKVQVSKAKDFPFLLTALSEFPVVAVPKYDGLGGLKTTEIYWLPRSPKWGCHDCCQVAGSQWCPLACGSAVPISASGAFFPAWLCPDFLYLTRTPVTVDLGLILLQHDTVLLSLHLRMLYFQRRSLLRVLGRHESCRNTIQSSANPQLEVHFIHINKTKTS